MDVDMPSGTQRPEEKGITEQAMKWLRGLRDKKAEGEVTAWIQCRCLGGSAIDADRKLNEMELRILEGVYRTIEFAKELDPSKVMPSDKKARARAIERITVPARRLAANLRRSPIPIPSALDLFDRQKLRVVHSRIVGDIGIGQMNPDVRASYARQLEAALATVQESTWDQPQDLADMLDRLIERVEQLSYSDHPSIENARLTRKRKALLAVLLHNHLKASFGEAPHKFIAACICLTYSEDHTEERDVADWLHGSSHNLI